jgi:hypothetical protein
MLEHVVMWSVPVRRGHYREAVSAIRIPSEAEARKDKEMNQGGKDTRPGAEYGSEAATTHYAKPAELYVLDVLEARIATCVSEIQVATENILQIISAPWNMQYLAQQRTAINQKTVTATLSLKDLADLLGPKKQRARDRRDRTIADDDFARLHEGLVALTIVSAHFDFVLFLATIYDDSVSGAVAPARRAIREAQDRFAAQTTASRMTASILERL